MNRGRPRDAGMKRGRPRDEVAIVQRKEDILAAATRVFASFGFPATDVQVIADDLEVGKATVYRYFPSKEELFFATVDRGMSQLSEHIHKNVDEVDDPVEKIGYGIFAFLEFFDLNPEIVELLIQERAVFRNREKPTYQAHRERNIKRWHDLFLHLIAQGRVRDIPVETITNTISNLLYGIIFTTYFATKRQAFRSRTNDVLSILFAGLLEESERANLNRYLILPKW